VILKSGVKEKDDFCKSLISWRFGEAETPAIPLPSPNQIS